MALEQTLGSLGHLSAEVELVAVEADLVFAYHFGPDNITCKSPTAIVIDRRSL